MKFVKFFNFELTKKSTFGNLAISGSVHIIIKQKNKMGQLFS